MCDQMNYGQYNQCESIGDGCSYRPPTCNQCETQSPPPSVAYERRCENPSQTNMMYCNMNQYASPPPSPPQREQEPCVQYCDPCYQSCEPMCYQPPCEPRPMFEQACNPFAKPYQPEEQENYCEPCIDVCRNRVKTPYRRRRYVQPPRRQSFKPSVCYKRPDIPMSDDTIYRRSFEGVDPSTAACCRVAPIRPNALLRTPCAKFEDETITKLSFQPYCRMERVRPIVPQSRSLLGKGPMQGLTTQRHDFVPKFQYKRMRVVPRDNIRKLNARFEKETVQRLSFMPPCVTGRVQSCKPMNSYKRPELPMEYETIHKLSYVPVCPAPREEMPWAQKARYLAPTIPFANDTVTKLSYQAPGCFIDDNECCYDPCNDDDMCYDAPRAAC